MRQRCQRCTLTPCSSPSPMTSQTTPLTNDQAGNRHEFGSHLQPARTERSKGTARCQENPRPCMAPSEARDQPRPRGCQPGRATAGQPRGSCSTRGSRAGAGPDTTHHPPGAAHRSSSARAFCRNWKRRLSCSSLKEERERKPAGHRAGLRGCGALRGAAGSPRPAAPHPSPWPGGRTCPAGSCPLCSSCPWRRGELGPCGPRHGPAGRGRRQRGAARPGAPLRARSAPHGAPRPGARPSPAPQRPPGPAPRRDRGPAPRSGPAACRRRPGVPRAPPPTSASSRPRRHLRSGAAALPCGRRHPAG